MTKKNYPKCFIQNKTGLTVRIETLKSPHLTQISRPASQMEIGELHLEK